jgi:hypothetical protein
MLFGDFRHVNDTTSEPAMYEDVVDFETVLACFILTASRITQHQ